MLDFTALTDDQKRELLEALRAFDAMHPEEFDIRANVTMTLTGPDGAVKETRRWHNTVCTAGKRKLLAVTSGEALTAFSYIAIGTGTTAAAAADTALQTEVARANGTTSNPDSDHYQVTYTFPAGTGTGAITEAGLLDAASTGNLLAHQVFSVVNKGAADTLAITWQIA